MTTSRTDSSEVLTPEQEKRRAVVVQMLAERDMRPKVSQEEIRRMRDEGRDARTSIIPPPALPS